MKNNNKMQIKSTKKGSLKRPRSLKSKGKEVSSSNSKRPESISWKRTHYADLYENSEAHDNVMERAERVLSNLENEFPNFLKYMLPSNVSHGFWLHLPAQFCSVNLPNHDTPIVLVDECGNEYTTSYLLYRHGLSAGWRGFSISHRLRKGDVLIFQLIEPCKFKVHIVRVYDLEVVDGALCLMSLATSARGTVNDIVKKDKRKRKGIYVDPFPTTSKNVRGNKSFLQKS